MAFSVYEQRDAFPGMVSRFRGRIAAVIGSDDEKIVPAKLIQYGAEGIIEFMHRCGISGDIVTVSVLHVEVDEVGKAQSREVPVHHLYSLCDTFGVAGSRVGFRYPAACEQVEDLAYRDDVKALLLEDVEHSGRRSAE